MLEPRWRPVQLCMKTIQSRGPFKRDSFDASHLRLADKPPLIFQGHLGENPFDNTSDWSKSEFTATSWPHAVRQCRLSDDGIMNREIDGDVAINLSTSQRPSAATTPNDAVDCEDTEQSPQNLDKVLDQSWEKERDRGLLSRENRERGEKESNTKDNGRNSSPGSVNREQQLGTTGRQQDDSRQHSPSSLRIPHSPDIVGQVSGTPNQGSAVTSSPTALPPVNQMIMSPSTSLHHMQQLLQQHVLTPNQLQSLMKQHSMYLQQSQHQQHPQHHIVEISKKQLEQTMQHLQEQIQLNLIQQSHILQSGEKKKSSGSFQQLALQQQQLIQQLQIIQRQYIVQQGMGIQPIILAQAQVQAQQGAGIAGRDVLSPWKEQTPESHTNTSVKSSGDVNDILPSVGMNRNLKEEQSLAFEEKLKEGNMVGGIDKVHHLYGHGVCKWPGCEAVCDDLQTFLKHLNTEHILDDRSTAQARVQMQVVSQLELQLQKERDRLQAMMHHLHMSKQLCSPEPHKGEPGLPGVPGTPGTKMCNSLLGNSQPNYVGSPITGGNVTQPAVSMSALVSAVRSPVMQSSAQNLAGPIRRRISDKSALSLTGGLPYMLERAGLDVQQEIQRNREFYKNADVRPPFTYASLIRQSIIESPDKQLTLNEIYNWFQNTFCYFRRNAATWKNAIRTNLSLHKCFVRYEDDFGSFWMVDDAEFVKRRHLSRGRPRKYDPTPSPTPPHLSSSAQGVTSKSPTMMHSPTIYVDAVNNIGQNNMMDESNLAFLSNSMMVGTLKHPNTSEPSEQRLSINGNSVHIKQENMVNNESGHRMPPVDIKREVPDHSVLEYEDIEQEHGEGVYGLSLPPNDVMAEDLSIVNDHIQDNNAMDM